MISFRYLEPKPVYATERLNIRGIGLHEVMPRSLVERPQGTGDCFFLLMHDAGKIGGEEHGPGTMVLWAEGDGHFYGSRAGRWSHSWVHCSGPLIDESLAKYGIVCGCPFGLFNPARVERYLLDLHEELRGVMKPEGRIVENTLENLIIEAARSTRTERQPAVPEPLATARQTIESRYDEPWTLTALAAEAHLSVPYFCNEFRRWHGVAPMAYLTRRRLEAAAFLLRSTALNVREVARRVGFEDPFHFSRQFKNSFGTAPAHFRKLER